MFDFHYVTPQEAFDMGLVESLEVANAMAADDSECDLCGQHVWRYGQSGMCFPCMTGESDCSEDYEIGNPYG